MGKKLILTEEQIKSVIGLNEDAFYYLGGSNPVGNTETFVDGTLEDRLGIPQPNDHHVFGLSKHKKHHDDDFDEDDFDDEDEDDDEEYTYDGIEHKLCPSGYWSNRLGSHRTIASMTENKKKINEENQDLKGLTFFYKDQNGIGYSGNEKALAAKKTRAKQRGDKETYKVVSNALDKKRAPVKRWKEFKSKVLNMPNSFQKAGGTKNNGGTAHTKKNDSLTTFFN